VEGFARHVMTCLPPPRRPKLKKMQKHVKNFMEAHGYGMDDFIPCHECGKRAVDIHHVVHRSQGGSDEASNLRALCRECHDKIHSK
jgi:5-methylcytosine-specific restriction endonuclease McrA